MQCRNDKSLMASEEENMPVKISKQAPNQEQPTTPSYANWLAPSQRIYGAGTSTLPAFFGSSAAPSPTLPPYMWSSQARDSIHKAREMEGKPSDGKGQDSVNKNKGTLGNTYLASGSNGNSGKAASSSANDYASESGREGGNSDAENTVQSFNMKTCSRANAQLVSMPGKLTRILPIPNNIEMDPRNASPADSIPFNERPNASGVSSAVVPAAMGEGAISEQLQIRVEHELKRQKRKESNRESAKRSRMRKQMECQELSTRVETMKNENRTLTNKLRWLAKECKKLESENASITEHIIQLNGHDATSTLDDDDDTNTPVIQSVAGDSYIHANDSLRKADSISSEQNGQVFISDQNFDRKID